MDEANQQISKYFFDFICIKWQRNKSSEIVITIKASDLMSYIMAGDRVLIGPPKMSWVKKGFLMSAANVISIRAVSSEIELNCLYNNNIKKN